MARQMQSRIAEEPDLEHLAAAARDGDEAAFDALVRRVGGRLVAFASRVLSDRGLGEEAVQEALVRIYRFLPRYRSENFTAWAFTITHRACMDIVRRERRTSPHLVEVPEPSPDPVEGADLRAVVDQALTKIPPQLRETFLLNQQGLAYEDVAAVLGIPIGTVRSRLHEARRLLRVLLSTALERGGDR